MTEKPTQFEREIREQPDVLERLLRGGRDDVEVVGALLRERRPSFVTIAARGTSDNAARYAKYALGWMNRLPVALAAPSLFTVYRTPPAVGGALVIGISQSGRSPDIVEVVAEGRRQGAIALAITNDPDSPLARTAEHVLLLRAGKERAIAATKTYSAELMTIAMLAAAIADDETARRQLADIPARVAEAIDAAAGEAIDRAASRCASAQRLVVLGRGFDYATAFEVALKIKETSYLLAEAYSFADFRHGPAALLERGFPVLLFAPAAHGELAPLLDLLAERDADVTAVVADRAIGSRASASVVLPSGVPEWLSPLVSIVPGQMFALGLARARGADPDRPRGLAKVTETR